MWRPAKTFCKTIIIEERTRLVRDGLSSFLKQHVTRDITTCSFEAGPGVIEFVKLSFYQGKHEYKCVLKTLWELGWLSACKRTSWHGYPPPPDKPTFLNSNSIRNHRQGVLKLNRCLFNFFNFYYLRTRSSIYFTVILLILAMKGYIYT